MRVLIVEQNPDRGWLWCSHIERQGATVDLVAGQSGAVEHIRATPPDVIVLNLELAEGSAFAIADYASFCRPSTKIIFVTSTTFFADGSIFSHCANACAYLRAETPPEDLAVMVAHYALH